MELEQLSNNSYDWNENTTPIWYYQTHLDDGTEERVTSRQEIVDKIQDKIDELNGCEMLFTAEDVIEILDGLIYA